jgi:hypothetical protein
MNKGEKTITERIKTYEDACNELGVTPIDESALLSVGFTKDEIACRKLKTITEALNEGWNPDWKDENQKKWNPFFRTSSGFVFDAADYSLTATYVGDGLRLCLKSKELAKYAGKHFIDLYRDFIL